MPATTAEERRIARADRQDEKKLNKPVIPDRIPMTKVLARRLAVRWHQSSPRPHLVRDSFLLEAEQAYASALKSIRVLKAMQKMKGLNYKVSDQRQTVVRLLRETRAHLETFRINPTEDGKRLPLSTASRLLVSTIKIYPGAMYDRRTGAIWYPTTPITLSDPHHADREYRKPVELGSLWIVVNPLSVTPDFWITVRSKDDTPRSHADGYTDYYHPHVYDDGHLCLNDVGPAYRCGLTTNNWFGAIEEVNLLLHFYNASSPIIALSSWIVPVRRCSGCHYVLEGDVEYETCNVCGQPLCPSCATHCDRCGHSFCPACRTFHDVDDETEMKVSRLCSYCAKQCGNCYRYFFREELQKDVLGRSYCKSCRKKCKECGRLVKTDAFFSEMEVCSSCHFRCTGCGEITPLANGSWLTASGLLTCSSCLNQCSQCGKKYLLNELVSFSPEGSESPILTCKECYDVISNSDTSLPANEEEAKETGESEGATGERNSLNDAPGGFSDVVRQQSGSDTRSEDTGSDSLERITPGFAAEPGFATEPANEEDQNEEGRNEEGVIEDYSG